MLGGPELKFSFLLNFPAVIQGTMKLSKVSEICRQIISSQHGPSPPHVVGKLPRLLVDTAISPGQRQMATPR